MTDIRLLTLNALIRGDVRPRLRCLGGILERSGYDIVCLQEILHRGSVRLLRRLTPGFGHHFASGFPVLHGGLMLLSRWPLAQRGFTLFPKAGPPRTELLMRKGAQAAVVETPGGPLAVVNTHLSANRDGDWSPGNRYARIARGEMAALAGVVAALDPTLPVVVAGDFNVPRDSPEFVAFAAAAGLHDVLCGDPAPTYRPTPRFPAPPALDQVLVRSTSDHPLAAGARLVLQDAVTLPGGREAFLSDHYGIDADLTFA